MALDLITITAVASGSAGTSTGSKTSDTLAVGRVVAVYVDITATAAGMDVTLAATNTPTESILELTDIAADVWVYPRRRVHDITGTGLTLEGTEPMVDLFVIHDTLTLSLDEADDGDEVTVYVFIEI
jgi:hypothetical protein